jgi:hypothetical protein
MSNAIDLFIQPSRDYRSSESFWTSFFALCLLTESWAALPTSCGFLDPMPEDRCPMCTDFRAPNLYGTPNAEIERALTPALRAHRDFVYEQRLELPIVL